MQRLSGKTAIITGGAGNIGQHITRRFAEEGANVVIVDNNHDKGKEIAEKYNVQFIETDVTQGAQVSKMVERVIHHFGRIDILCNHVGRARGSDLLNIDEQTFEFNFNINLKSSYLCTRAVLPFMKEQSSGTIIFSSSINVLLGGFSESAYAATKAGLHSLVQTLTADYSRYGIRFNVICLGSIPAGNPVWKQREEASPGTMQAIADLYPLRRVGLPEDAANAYLFLASDESAWITGTCLTVDGGLSATGNLPGAHWWNSQK